MFLKNPPPTWKCLKHNKIGFTLSEVLITLVIIGVVSAISLQIINNNSRKEQYKSSLFKMLSTLNQANLKYYNTYGENPQCGYWTVNPYAANGNGAVCVGRNDQGACNRWQMKDGSNLPSDYNGFFSDCTQLWQSYYQNLNVQKICRTNAYSNGCIPKYKGRDNMYAAKNPDASDYDIMAAVASSGFLQSSILSGSAIVLTDGSIIFSYMRESTRYFAVDVNGHKGPNKWGVDVYALMPKMENALDIPKFKFDTGMIEQGGKTANKLLYK